MALGIYAKSYLYHDRIPRVISPSLPVFRAERNRTTGQTSICMQRQATDESLRYRDCDENWRILSEYTVSFVGFTYFYRGSCSGMKLEKMGWASAKARLV